MSTTRTAATVGLVLAAALLGACDSPGSGSSNQGNNQGNNPPAKTRYSWTLPIGDVSPNYSERTVYLALKSGNCSAAEQELNDNDNWHNFASPRNVLLTQAAIQFCKGDETGGTAMYRRAEKLGWKGLLPPGDNLKHASCELYKAESSVINQKPMSDYSCNQGKPPPWESEVVFDRKDPR